MGRTPKDPTKHQLPAAPGNQRYKSRPSKYTEQEIEHALTALALQSGNARRAERMLKGQGDFVVGADTLRRWVKRFPEEYERIRAEKQPQIEAELMEWHIDLARQSIELERRVIERMAETVDEIPARDLAGVLRNISTTGAIHTDKIPVLRGGGQAPAPKESITELFRALSQFKGIITFNHPLADVDSTAEDITPKAKPLPEGQRGSQR